MSPEQTRIREAKDDAILALLGKLALHYWRPDFTPQQAKQLYRDYLDDLRPFALSDIAAAIVEHRQDGTRHFFPLSGQIIDLIIGKPEVDARGYTDRFDALASRRSWAIGRGHAEANEMRLRLTGEPRPALPAPEFRRELPSKPIASDLPDHPNLVRHPPYVPGADE